MLESFVSVPSLPSLERTGEANDKLAILLNSSSPNALIRICFDSAVSCGALSSASAPTPAPNAALVSAVSIMIPFMLIVPSAFLVTGSAVYLIAEAASASNVAVSVNAVAVSTFTELVLTETKLLSVNTVLASLASPDAAFQ